MTTRALLVLLLLSSADAHAVCVERAYDGRAYDRDTGDLLYVESHRERVCDGERVESVVTYRYAQGDTFGVKRLDFGTTPLTPRLHLAMRHNGYEEGSSLADDRLVVFRRKSAGRSLEQAELPLEEITIVDGGFDAAVRRHWDRLEAGDRLEARFAVPDKLSQYRFRIRRLAMADGMLSLRIEPASFWLRLIAPHIDVTYDVETRRLMRYEGITNVPTASGRKYRARIEFDYADRSSVARAPS